jgi:hypothetical protein
MKRPNSIHRIPPKGIELSIVRTDPFKATNNTGASARAIKFLIQRRWLCGAVTMGIERPSKATRKSYFHGFGFDN